ncbi:hypothetical protein BGZ63DRAFT_148699 [Mariannaea sp. PMI_226]|nr:hypothetical protein BGZ63DRAFT_148699 [Mariannaea sp. PMI_226]
MQQHIARIRRRTGCTNCRSRRVKCDEKKPICGNCSRKGVSCSQTERFVHDQRSIGTRPPRSGPNADLDFGPSALALAGTAQPETTYDALQLAQTAPRFEGPSQSSQAGTQVLRLGKQTADLVQRYQNGIGTWLDVLDHQVNYTRHVVRIAFCSRLVLYSICALTAKQLSLASIESERPDWEAIAARYYGESLGLLINHLNQPDNSHEIELTAAIALCSYELLDHPGVDYKRHLDGARSLIQSRKPSKTWTELEKASFWVFARQDVAMALVNESPTLILPDEWRPLLPTKLIEEDALGNKVLWLLAQIIELRFGSSASTVNESEWCRIQDLRRDLDQWFTSLPPTYHGIPISGTEESGLVDILLTMTSTMTGLLYYHLARMLLLEHWLLKFDGLKFVSNEVPRFDRQYLESQLQTFAQSTMNISFSSGLPHSVWPVAVNPLFYAARYAPQYDQKLRIWAFLHNIEEEVGFHTKSRVLQSQRERCNQPTA